MRILVVGTGGVGAAFAAIARSRSFFEHCALADYDPARPETVVGDLDDGRFSAHRVDASSAEDVGRLIRATRADAVLNAVDPVFNMPIFSACLESRVTYLDMAMSLSQPHPEHPHEQTYVKLGDEQFAQGPAWEQAGLLALVGIGIEPGAADVFARHAADELFSEIDEVGVRDGSNLVVEGYDFAPTFSIWTTIEECLNPPVIWEKGRGWYTTAPFSEPEVFDFPEGIGPVECVNVEHEEVLLVPRWIDCKRVTFKYGLGDEFIEVLKTLHKLGLDSKETHPGEGRRGRAARCRRRRAPRPGDARRAHARKDVRGDARHRTRKGRQPAEDLPLPRRRQRVVDAGVRLAGSRLADGDQPGHRARAPRRAASGPASGVLGPEAFPPQPFLDEARRVRRAARRPRARTRRTVAVDEFRAPFVVLASDAI